MRFLNDLILDNAAVSLSENSDAALMDMCFVADLVARIASNNASNKTFDTGFMDVKTLTFPTKAGAANGDYIVLYDEAGISYAVALTKPVAAIDTITFPAFAGAADGDYVALTDGSGLSWGLAMDTTGLAANAPTGAVWAAIPSGRKAYVDISGAITPTNVCDAMRTAANLLSGFTAAITTSGTTTFIATMIVKAPVAAPSVHNKDDSGAGTITATNGTVGVAAQTPTGVKWTAATHKGLADISPDTTAAQVAARAETALNLLTGFTAAITSDDAANNGTMLITQIIPGVVANAVPKTFNDGAAGSISASNTTAGTVSEVDVAANTLHIPGHGLITGVKFTGITTTGTLPGPLATSTPYYAIYIDDDNISLAATQTGTAIDLTDYGTSGAVHTLVIATALAGTVKLQKNSEPQDAVRIWRDLDNAECLVGNASQTFSGATTLTWVLRDFASRELRAVVATTSGSILISIRINAKG